MKKIVINRCYGGFGLSKKAVLRYAELKNIKIYVHKDGYNTHFYKIPVKKYNKLKDFKEAHSAYFSVHNIPRDDIHLVQVVEELKEKANKKFSELKIVEIPDDVDWEIDAYDGKEWVQEKHRTWY